MNIQQLETGKNISEEIKTTKEEIEKWEKSFGLSNEYIKLESNEGRRHAMPTSVDFDTLKAVTLSSLQKKLSLLQKEFKEL